MKAYNHELFRGFSYQKIALQVRRRAFVFSALDFARLWWLLWSLLWCVRTGCDMRVSYFVSMICSCSWAFLHSSSAGAKLFPTFMNSAAILLLRRKPATRRFSPCRTHASTAAVWTQKKIYFYVCNEQQNNYRHQKPSQWQIMTKYNEKTTGTFCSNKKL